MLSNFLLRFLICCGMLLSFSIVEAEVSQTANSRPLNINLISTRNGKGLQIDQNILLKALSKLGHRVLCLELFAGVPEARHADINIFLQFIDPELFSIADSNWLIPNPEWYTQDLALLEHIDLVLCKTGHAINIFADLGSKTYFLGFTSRDCIERDYDKDYTTFFHLAGGSLQKGTATIMDVWKNSPSLGKLFVLHHMPKPAEAAKLKNLKWINTYLPFEDVRALQNQCGIHLCLSEAEGFGHYIMEGMSTGAVVITTDAPPMNELITDKRCLVPYKKQAAQNLATNYYVDSAAFANTLNNLLKLPQSELEKIGQSNRSNFLIRDAMFLKRFDTLLKEYCNQPSRKFNPSNVSVGK